MLLGKNPANTEDNSHTKTWNDLLKITNNSDGMEAHNCVLQYYNLPQGTAVSSTNYEFDYVSFNKAVRKVIRTGLHFTEELLAKAAQKGVRIAYVTLHVGIGTFRPVKVDVIEEHKMHFEECSVDEKNAEIINSTIESGGRIISVGTTSTRTLESMAVPADRTDAAYDKGFRIEAGSKSTGIFIYPGYSFRIVDALITNFHLPKSTLLMLVSALYDREEILKAYRIAVEERYRFFSYGDAMIIC